MTEGIHLVEEGNCPVGWAIGDEIEDLPTQRTTAPFVLTIPSTALSFPENASMGSGSKLSCMKAWATSKVPSWTVGTVSS